MSDDGRSSWMERPLSSVKFDVDDSAEECRTKVCLSQVLVTKTHTLYSFFLFKDNCNQIKNSLKISVIHCRYSRQRESREYSGHLRLCVSV